jgi:hypothetical protein
MRPARRVLSGAKSNDQQIQEKTEVQLAQAFPLPPVRQGSGVPEGFRALQNMFPPDGAQGGDPRRDQGELVGVQNDQGD